MVNSHATRYEHAIVDGHFQDRMNNRARPPIFVFAIKLRLSGSTVDLQYSLP